MRCIFLAFDNMFLVRYDDLHVYWRSYNVSKITNVKVDMYIILKYSLTFFNTLKRYFEKKLYSCENKVFTDVLNLVFTSVF